MNNNNLKPKISIIIPTFNRKKVLTECLVSIFSQNYQNFEIIIIDNASTDNTTQFLKEKYPQIKIIANDLNLGPAYARNQGISEATGKILLFLDSDVELINKDTLERIVKLLSENKKMGSVGGEIIAELNEPTIAYGRNIQKNGVSIRVGCQKKEGLKECDYLPTSNCATKKEMAFAVGGFDPYYVYGAEDKEFGFLIKQKGYKNYIDYETAVLHKFSEQGRIAIDPHYHWCKTTLRFLLKHRFFKKIPYLLTNDIKFIIKRGKKALCSFLKPNDNRENEILKCLAALKWLIAAYLWNLIHFFQTLRSKDKNFLSLEEINKFKK